MADAVASEQRQSAAPASLRNLAAVECQLFGPSGSLAGYRPGSSHDPEVTMSPSLSLIAATATDL